MSCARIAPRRARRALLRRPPARPARGAAARSACVLFLTAAFALCATEGVSRTRTKVRGATRHGAARRGARAFLCALLDAPSVARLPIARGGGGGAGCSQHTNCAVLPRCARAGRWWRAVAVAAAARAAAVLCARHHPQTRGRPVAGRRRARARRWEDARRRAAAPRPPDGAGGVPCARGLVCGTRRTGAAGRATWPQPEGRHRAPVARAACPHRLRRLLLMAAAGAAAEAHRDTTAGVPLARSCGLPRLGMGIANIALGGAVVGRAVGDGTPGDAHAVAAPFCVVALRRCAKSDKYPRYAAVPPGSAASCEPATGAEQPIGARALVARYVLSAYNVGNVDLPPSQARSGGLGREHVLAEVAARAANEETEDLIEQWCGEGPIERWTDCRARRLPFVPSSPTRRPRHRFRAPASARCRLRPGLRRWRDARRVCQGARLSLRRLRRGRVVAEGASPGAQGGGKLCEFRNCDFRGCVRRRRARPRKEKGRARGGAGAVAGLPEWPPSSPLGCATAPERRSI